MYLIAANRRSFRFRRLDVKLATQAQPAAEHGQRDTHDREHQELEEFGADPGRPRIHADATGALPGCCRRSPLEPPSGKPRGGRHGGILGRPARPGAAVNLADALVAPNVLRPHLKNWTEVVGYFVRSVEADAAADGTTETAALRDRLLGYPDVRETMAAASAQASGAPVLAMHFEKGQTTLKLFTTIATLGTPQDITLQELRIECFFPIDAKTKQSFQAWASPRKEAERKR